MRRRIAFALWGVALGVACGPSTGGENHNGWNDNYNNTGPCTDGELRCDTSASAVEVCVNGTWQTHEFCSGQTPYCYNAQCVVCVPGTRYCEGNNVMQCDQTGMSGTLVQGCETGTTCTGGQCVSPCKIAEQRKSYIGCDYWPTPTANTQLDPAFENDFAVAVHNPNDQPAQVVVTKGSAQVATEQVGPGEIKTIKLPYDPTLKGSFDPTTGFDWPAVARVQGAYHLVSSMPVTVYQFNPLNYELPQACTQHTDPSTGAPEQPCHSYTNDASLLLPSHVLSTHYMVMARPTFGVYVDYYGMGPQWDSRQFTPGFFAVVAIQNGTTVTVHFSAYTMAGDGLQHYSPGDTAQFQLDAGEVLQVLSDTPNGSCPGQESHDDCNGQGVDCYYCNAGSSYDLTGTVIESTAPVAVFSGHVCDFVPYNYWACDHLEEQMIPSEAWGKDYIVARTEPQSPGTPEPNVIKIVSRENGNQITFDPPSVHQPVTLNAGEYLVLQSGDNFRVTGTQPMMVAQFLVGQNYYTNDLQYWGDPAFALVVPFEQYRSSYSFLTPATITYNYVNVIAPVGESGENIAGVTLDGQVLDFTAGRLANYGIARVNLSSSGSAHSITGSQPFGIMVYGFARYTSYFYPGGLDLEFINPVE